MANHDPARVTEIEKESVEFKHPTRISGALVEPGDSVDVYPFERRHLVAANYCEGGIEDMASEAEKGQGNLEILKRVEDREGRYYSMDELWEMGDATGSSDEGEEAPAEENEEH